MDKKIIPSILIVDDKYENVMLLETMLSYEYNVKTLQNGFEAIEYAKENIPDLILLDIMMPEIDGFQVCKKLKEIEATRDIPVIFITAITELDYKIEGFNIGGVDYITKPFHQEEVFQRVKTHLTIVHQQYELKHAANKLSEANTKLDYANKQLKDKIIQIRKTTEQKLESELKLKSILSNLDVIIWRIDKKGVFALIEGNDTTQSKIFTQDIIGKSYREVFKAWPMIIDGIRKALTGEPGKKTISVKGNYIELSFSPKYNLEDELDGIVGLVFDITELKKVQNELIEAKTEVENSSREKGAFYANISREILTPVEVILKNIESILDKQITDISSEVEEIRNNSLSVKAIVGDLADLSMLESNRVKLNPKAIKINDTLKKLLETYNQLNDYKIENQLPDYLLIDKKYTFQIVKYITCLALSLSENKRFDFKLRYVKNMQEPSKIDYLIEICDSNTQLTTEEAETIKAGFNVNKMIIGKKVAFSGIGFPLTLRLLKFMNGSINVISEDGQGTVYQIRFNNVNICTSKGKIILADEEAVSDIIFEKAKILIAEEKSDIRKSIKSLLQGSDIEFIEYTDGKEAVINTRKLMPDIVLISYSLPVLNGVQANKVMKDQNAMMNIPVIILTQNSVEMRDAEKHKFEGYIRKPVKKTELYQQLMRFLRYRN